MKKDSSKAGFTLVEVLVSIFILSIATSAILFFIVDSLSSAQTIKNNYTASLLAQEGMEIVRNIRDNEWFTAGTFGDSLTEGQSAVQWDSLALIQPYPDLFLKRNAAGFFNYSVGTDTIFKRRINVIRVSDVERIITVTINWQEKKGGTKTLNAEEHLFDWYRD